MIARPLVRVVIDTNVIVSALLKQDSVSARAVRRLLDQATILLDARLLEEYAAVLARPKFAHIEPLRRDALLARLRAEGELVAGVLAYEGPLDDPDDRPFLEVALAGRASAIVTGNVRDFPANLGFEVLPPAIVLARLEPATASH